MPPHGQPAKDLPIESGSRAERFCVRRGRTVPDPGEAVRRIASLKRADDERRKGVEEQSREALRLHDSEILTFEGGLSEVRKNPD